MNERLETILFPKENQTKSNIFIEDNAEISFKRSKYLISNIMKKQLLAFIVLFFAVTGLTAGTLTVGTTGTYANVQLALLDAVDGDEIHILTGGTYDGFIYNGPGSLTVKNMSGVTVVLDGTSPALTVTNGTIYFDNVTFVTTTDDPTILITGGKLILRNSTIIEATGFNQDGIYLSGGELDAGIATDPGHNTFVVNGAGKAINNFGGITASAIENYWGGTDYNIVLSRFSGTVHYDPWCNSTFTQCDYSVMGGPVTTAAQVVGCNPPSVVNVPVTVDTFANVDAISLTLDYDPSVLVYTGFTAHSSLAANFSVNAVYPGRLKLAWFSFSGGVTIPGPIVEIVNLSFNYLGGTSALVWNDSDAVWCEYSNALINGPFNDVPTANYYINGWVTELPAAIAGPDTAVCQSIPTQTLTATATPVFPGNSIVWYDAPTGGNVVQNPILNAPGTVTYYAANSDGVCTTDVRVPVTLHMDPVNDATIAYNNANNLPYFCTNGTTVDVTLTGTTGGLFSVQPAQGLNLNPTTGQVTITGSTAGTYVVAYTMQAVGLCPANTVTTPFTLTQLPTITTYEYDSPFCFDAPNALPTLVASNTNGIHTIPNPPLGLVFDNITGELFLGGASLPNTYTMLYTIPAALGCPDVTKTTIVTVQPPFTAIATMTEETCIGFADGTATVTTTNGIQPFTYLWDDPAAQTTQTATGLTSGTYSVTVTDDNNCEAVASVTVTTINDTIDPVIVCPQVASFYNVDPGACYAELTFNATATDNCDIDVIKYYVGTVEITFPFQFPVGTTTVEAIAYDLNGNSDDCLFSVVVIDNIDPVITCPAVAASYNVDPGQCYAELSLIASATDNCAIDYIKYYIGTTEITFPYQFPVGTTTVEAIAYDLSGNSDNCTFDVIVIDNIDPIITCPTVAASYSVDAGQCYATLSFTATATDNCSIDVIKYYIGTTEISFPYQFPVGTTTVEAVAFDLTGNTDDCTFDVIVVDDIDPVITCPSVAASYSVDAGQCYATLSFTATATDNCTIDVIKYYIGTTEITFPYQFQVGTTIVDAIAYDLAGNSDDCTFSVVVIDDIDPVVTCPTVAASYNVDPGQCYAELSFSATATDNCGIDFIKYYIGTTEITFPYQFPVGTSSVLVVAQDLSGNIDNCNFSVVVVDNIDPVITCPTVAATYSVDAGQCYSTLSFNATATDNCAIDIIRYYIGTTEITFPYQFPVGTTTVEAVAFDLSGNTDDCTFDVIVIDDIDPVITCPSVAASYSVDAGECFATLSFTATATDNCTIDFIKYYIGTTEITFPYQFNVGTTTVEAVAQDLAGNTDNCTFDVIVVDDELPTIVCPVDIKTIYAPDDCDAIVNAGWPQRFDNCGIDTVAWVRSDMLSVTDPYPGGITTITWTAIDIHNNSQSCVQTIEVTPAELILLYNFDNAVQYPIAPDFIAPNLAGYCTSFEPFLTTNTGTPTGTMAFVSDPTVVGNKSLAMGLSNGNNARYFEFRVSGDSLYKFRDYQIYIQGRREVNAATQIAAYYSFDGLAFWPGDSITLPAANTWFQGILDLTGHDTINYKKDIYIRLFVKGSNQTSGGTMLDIDNFQMVAINGPLARPDYVTVQMNTPITIDVLANDYYGCNGPAAMLPIIGVDVANNGTSTMNPNGTFTYLPDPNFLGQDFFTYRICDGIGNCDTAIVYLNVVTPDLYLAPKVFLQGAYDVTSGLMSDNLRLLNFIPTTEPYSSAPYSSYFTHAGGGGGEVITDPNVLTVSGSNAIVDWVYVELRDKADSTIVVATRAALVQSDGDVVDVDGISPVKFNGLVDNEFFVAIRHRNHLGVMTANTVTLTLAGTPVNFTDGSVAEFNFGTQFGYNYSTLAQKQVAPGVRALHAGNAEPDNKVKYQGVNNDNNRILNQVLAYPGNILYEYNYNFATGYFSGDINMDGQVKYQGVGSDSNYLLNIILNYIAGATPSFDFMIEQLP